MAFRTRTKDANWKLAKIEHSSISLSAEHASPKKLWEKRGGGQVPSWRQGDDRLSSTRKRGKCDADPHDLPDMGSDSESHREAKGKKAVYERGEGQCSSQLGGGGVVVDYSLRMEIRNEGGEKKKLASETSPETPKMHHAGRKSEMCHQSEGGRRHSGPPPKVCRNHQTSYVNEKHLIKGNETKAQASTINLTVVAKKNLVKSDGGPKGCTTRSGK